MIRNPLIRDLLNTGALFNESLHMKGAYKETLHLKDSLYDLSLLVIKKLYPIHLYDILVIYTRPWLRLCLV